MDEPTPADDWPDDPLSESEAEALLDRRDVDAVWVMDGDDTTRAAILGPPHDDDAVIDIVLETAAEFRMYSYTHGPDGTQWMDYGVERKGEAGAERMADTLAAYRLLAGETDLQSE